MIVCVCCVFLSTVDDNHELPEDFDEEFFREIHQKGGTIKPPQLQYLGFFALFCFFLHFVCLRCTIVVG